MGFFFKMSCNKVIILLYPRRPLIFSQNLHSHSIISYIESKLIIIISSFRLSHVTFLVIDLWYRLVEFTGQIMQDTMHKKVWRKSYVRADAISHSKSKVREWKCQSLAIEFAFRIRFQNSNSISEFDFRERTDLANLTCRLFFRSEVT